MTRRILGIVSFLLAAYVIVSTTWMLVDVLMRPGRHGLPAGFFLWMSFPLAGVVASLCNGIHLLYGSVAGSPLRRLLHVSNLVHGVFAVIGAFTVHFTVAYQASTMNMPMRDYLLGHLPALVPLPIVVIYMVLLFWRGAVGDPPRR